jgi:ribosomal protein S12 methylthiotransferase accessory factor
MSFPLLGRPQVLSSRRTLLCVAPAIAAGQSVQELVRELGQYFPQIKSTKRFSGCATFALWFQISIVRGHHGRVLGEPRASPETAERNLKNVRVRIHSVDVQGVEKLSAALHEVGVRLTKRSADLTVTLVNDYLEERLAELNRQHLSDQTSWLLVQPSGVFPLVGPVFRPRKSACWSCLAERMRRNREVKAFLDRKKSIPVVTSPLARNIFGKAGSNWPLLRLRKLSPLTFGLSYAITL